MGGLLGGSQGGTNATGTNLSNHIIVKMKKPEGGSGGKIGALYTKKAILQKEGHGEAKGG